MTKPWWHNGIHFTCTESGTCCKTNGEFAYVYLTQTEIQKAAAYLKLGIRAFRKQFITKEDGHNYVKDPLCDCAFLKDGKCTIYPVRPQQCKDWPFWCDNLISRKVWQTDVLPLCRGCRNGEAKEGRFYSAKAIQDILDTQKE